MNKSKNEEASSEARRLQEPETNPVAIDKAQDVQELYACSCVFCIVADCVFMHVV